MKHLIEFNLETLEVIKIDPIFEEVDGTMDEVIGVPEELIIEPITIIDSDTATVIYEGALPYDREGYTKTLYYGYENNDNNDAVVLLNKSLTVNQPIVYAIYTEIEGWFEVANQKDVEYLKLQNSGCYGLGFKSGDNSVNLKTPEINLGLNDFTVEIWARTEGAKNPQLPLIGYSKTNFISDAFFKIYPLGDSNSIDWLLITGKQEGDTSRSININKHDSTKNLHHIVITRQGTLVTATINGRLIKTVTQDRVLDFSQFVFDIANTTYFSIGRVFNYCMSADEVQMLWNGGRVDEVVLDNGMYDKKDYNYLIVETGWGADAGYSVSKNDKGKIIVTVNGNRNGTSWPWTLKNYPYSRVYLKIKTLNNCVAKINFENISFTTSGVSGEEFEFITPNNVNGHIQITTDSHNPNEDGEYIAYEIVECFSLNCLLELLPQNIHSSGIYNTGSLGSSHDAVLSKPNETVFIKEPQYKDKQMSTGAPNFHPIAMGQECYNTVNGDIYRASIPPVEREWSVADWKKINI